MSAWDGIAWLREAREFGSDYCVTFARGLEPLELLTRMGCDPGTAAPMGLVDATETYFDTGVETIRAGTSRGWAYAVETTGNRGFEEGVLAAVSTGTEAVLVYSDCNPVAYLLHAQNGAIVCGFEEDAPEDRIGTDPDRLLPHMIAAGLLTPHGTTPDDDAPTRGCELRMAESVFGLDLPHDTVVHGTPRGRTAGRTLRTTARRHLATTTDPRHRTHHPDGHGRRRTTRRVDDSKEFRSFPPPTMPTHRRGPPAKRPIAAPATKPSWIRTVPRGSGRGGGIGWRDVTNMSPSS
ncbi:DUF6461 domain-containing protein [Embleya sp. NPDC050154]|uniref:DUF6461 domain-containing protein n=1 Tax=unclassified Embleya TaxID=2699296 RepID=UPI0037AEA1CE